MRVLYFGTYQRDYPRNAQVISCLRRAGVEVIEHHVPVWDGRRPNWNAGPITALRLVGAQARLLRRGRLDADAVIVGYPGHLDLPAARRAAGDRTVIFNPLVSLFDTLVADRRRFGPGSRAARVLAAIDRRALRSADVVVADTQANADFLAELAQLPERQLAVCFVGAEEKLFSPGWNPQEPATAVFVGKLIPLHGLETILAAAQFAPDLNFRVIGSGQLQRLLESRPANVEWIPWVEYERLPDELRRAGCALGVFGTSDKARRVIPNKAFQALACGVPLVTADTPAARELLSDGTSALLVPPGDPEALAEAVRRVLTDTELAHHLAEQGHAVYRERASEEVLGGRWRALIESRL